MSNVTKQDIINTIRKNLTIAVYILDNLTLDNTPEADLDTLYLLTNKLMDELYNLEETEEVF